MGKLEKPDDVSGWENSFSPHLKQGFIAQWCGVVPISYMTGKQWKSGEQSLQPSRGDCTGPEQEWA